MVLRAIQDYIDGFSSDFTNLSIDWSIDISGLTTFVSFVVSSELFKTVTIIFAWFSIIWGGLVVIVDMLRKVEDKEKLLKDIKILDGCFRFMSSCFFLGMISLKDPNYVWQMLPLFWTYYVCIIGVAPFRFSQWLLKKAFKLIISYQKKNVNSESFAIFGEFDEKPHWPPAWVGIIGFFILVYLTFTGHIFSVLALATVATTIYLFEDYRLRGFQLEEDE